MTSTSYNDIRMVTDEAYKKFEEDILTDIKIGLQKVHKYLENKYSIYLHTSPAAEILIMFPSDILQKHIYNIKKQPINIKLLNNNAIEVIINNKNLYYILDSLWKDVKYIGNSSFNIECTKKTSNKCINIMQFNINNHNFDIVNKIFYVNLLSSYIQNLTQSFYSISNISEKRKAREPLKDILQKLVILKSKNSQANISRFFSFADKFPYNLIHVEDGNFQSHIYINNSEFKFQVGFYNIELKSGKIIEKFNKYLQRNYNLSQEKIAEITTIYSLKKLYNRFKKQIEKTNIDKYDIENYYVERIRKHVFKTIKIFNADRLNIKGNGTHRMNVIYNITPKDAPSSQKVKLNYTSLQKVNEMLDEMLLDNITNDLYIGKLISYYDIYSKEYSYMFQDIDKEIGKNEIDDAKGFFTDI